MKKIWLMMMLALASAATFSGCNTMRGAGQDVEKAGEKMQDAAEDCSDAGGCDD